MKQRKSKKPRGPIEWEAIDGRYSLVQPYLNLLNQLSFGLCEVSSILLVITIPYFPAPLELVSCETQSTLLGQ